MEGLLRLYHPDAVLDSSNESVEGRDAIAHRLNRYSRKFVGVTFRLVDTPRHDGPLLTFTTDVTGRAGRWMLRHAWQMEGGRIRHHGIESLPLPQPMPTLR